LEPTDLLSWRETMLALGVSSPTLYAIVDERKELEPAEVRKIGLQTRRFFRRGDVEQLRRQREGAQVKEA
jgi:predicted DNA-binding transcriptional regulator AlpA